MQEAQGRQRMVAMHSTAGLEEGDCEEPALLVLGGRRCEHTGVLCGGCEHREPHLQEACGGWKRGR